MLRVSVIISASPRKVRNSARVVMNEGMPNRARNIPATAPIAAPSTTVTAMAAPMFQPASKSTPMRPQENATAEPTLMSISPATITSVIPIAMMPAKAAWRRMFSMFSAERKFGAVAENTAPRVAHGDVAQPQQGWIARGPLRAGRLGHPLAAVAPHQRDALAGADLEVHPVQGLHWFTGGLLVTCGLGSIGAVAGAPLHGDVSHRPASAIRIAPSRGRPRVSLRADVESESVFGPALRVQRRIRSGFDSEGRPFLDIRDRVVNTGVVPAPVHLLYHVNLGAPLVVPGTRVELPAATTTPRDDTSRALDSRVLPAARSELSEAVFHHAPEEGPEPTRAARVISPAGQAVELAWSHATLPHLHQWVLPTRGRWALALEPATVALPGECFPRTPPPVLAPGDRRTHRLRLTLH